MLRPVAIIVAVSVCCAVCRDATSATILQPVAVVAQPPLGELNASFHAANLIDQTGLSAGYTSLVDDFDTYLATSPTHSHAVNNSWLSTLGNPTGNLDFDLGGLFLIEKIALWNLGNNAGANLTGFTLLADDNSAFNSPVILGSFSANPNTGPTGAVVPEVFSFSPTSATHVRIQITSNNGATITGTGEVAFAAMPVPEPASWLLAVVGIALGAVLFYRAAHRLANVETARTCKH